MRLGVVPENFIDLIALASGKLPTPLLETFWGISIGSTVVVATRLGVFECLVNGKETAGEVARETGCHGEAMKTLLNALNGFGYLRRSKGNYSLTKKSEKWLTTKSNFSIRDTILFIGKLISSLEDTESIIKSGVTKNFHDPTRPPEFWRDYLRSLSTLAKPISNEIVRKIKLDREPLRLLDVGGGHGIFSVSFCKRYPELQADIIDLKPAVREGRKIVREEGYVDRVKFIEGDVREINWGKDYDIVLFFNIIHNVSIDEARELLINAYKSLNNGGTLIIFDSEHIGEDKKLSTTSGFNELMFYVINGTCVYPEEVINKWIIDAGFDNLKKSKLLTIPMTFLTSARK